MWGSKRDKQTSFVTNRKALSILQRKCNHQPHEHEPWGVNRSHGEWFFATAEECEYPKELCEAVATALAKAMRIPDPKKAPVRRKQKSKPSVLSAVSGSRVGKQSKRAVHQQFTKDFKEVHRMKLGDARTA